MASASYALEHFYFGQLVKDGKPTGELRLLAASAGVKPELVLEAVQQALIPPLASSWGLVRGKSVPFIVVQSQLGSARQPVLHFIFVPAEVVRAMGGNLDVMRTLLRPDVPTYEKPENVMPPVALPQAGPPSPESQMDAMLALMGYTRDRLNVVEALLAALIQGVPIIVQGAPDNLDQRTTFVAGLLALLPPPARFGVTFATHSLPSTRVDAQIRFLPDDTAPDGALIYKWGQPTLSGKKVDDQYSHFIISQLRLDTELVITQTAALTPVAAWRIKRGDSLAEALRYGSHRLKIDDALLNNQPVELEDVSKILAEDPTLNDSVRANYVHHLMILSLALGDTQRLDSVSVMLRQNAELEAEVIAQMSNALSEGKTALIYDTLSRWLTNPLGPRAKPWILLLHRAALTHLDALVKAKDGAGANTFLQQLTRSGQTIEVERIIHKVIETALPLGAQDQDLAQTLFLLAAAELQVGDLQTILRERPFVSKLPKSLARLAPFLNGEEADPSPSGLLAEAASELGEQGQSLALIRLTEVALLSDRRDLVDTSALAGLAHAADTSLGAQYDQLFRWVVRSLSDDEFLTALDDPGPRFLLQILFARRAYAELVNELSHHSRVLYSVDNQANFAVMVRRVFAETAVPVTEIPGALLALRDAGLKPLALAMAHLGVLQRHQWPIALDQLAAEVTNLLFNNRMILEVITPDMLVELLEFHAKRRDANNAIRVAGLLPVVAARRSESGLPALSRMYQALNWDEKTRAAALEVLRRFIRRTDDPVARLSIARFSKELGEPVGKALEASYAFRRLLGGEDMADFAAMLHEAAKLLFDTTTAYVDKNRAPNIRSLINDLNSLFGNLSDDQRKAIGNHILGTGRAAVLLGRQYRETLPRNADEHINLLLQGKAAPRNALEVFFVMGGYFARGRRLDPTLEAPTANHPLMDRSGPSVMRDAETTDRVLRSALKAFPLQGQVALTAEAIQGETESLWGDIPLHERRELVRDLAIDLQRIPQLVAYITEHGDAKAMEEKSGLSKKIDSFKYRPESTLEFYRFLYGYFRSELKL